MPFDGSPMIDHLKPLGRGDHSPLPFTVNPAGPGPGEFSPIPAWHQDRGGESVDSTIAVLNGARALIAHERHWSRGAFARSWANIAVKPQSLFARRFCAIGALNRAACELLLPMQNARLALEAQAGHRLEGWNDHPKRTHTEVLALLDAAIHALRNVHA
jgi:hypothetical protein